MQPKTYSKDLAMRLAREESEAFSELPMGAGKLGHLGQKRLWRMVLCLKG